MQADGARNLEKHRFLSNSEQLQSARVKMCTYVINIQCVVKIVSDERLMRNSAHANAIPTPS